MKKIVREKLNEIKRGGANTLGTIGQEPVTRQESGVKKWQKNATFQRIM